MLARLAEEYRFAPAQRRGDAIAPAGKAALLEMVSV
jgi:hypothetical protein